MNRSEKTVKCFCSGCNCAQAVFTAFCKELKPEEKTGLKIACPLGGGLGHTDGVCGAVSGALLTIGLKYGPENPENEDLKVRNYKIAQCFISAFKKHNGSVNCTELIRFDLSDESQLNLTKQSGVFQTTCPKYVSNAVEILESIL